MKNIPANNSQTEQPSGILLVNKSKNKSSFSIVGALRRILKVQKIGHAGTLDPFATGVMVMLVGKAYTKQSDKFLCADKEYEATVHLGIETDTYDCDGTITAKNDSIPTLEELMKALENFQGTIEQIPPMYSAKKKNGKKLHELARKGITIDRAPTRVELETKLIDYTYPFVRLHIRCSKGTYIRSIAFDLGRMLKCGAHLSALERTRSGLFGISECLDHALLDVTMLDSSTIANRLIKQFPN